MIARSDSGAGRVVISYRRDDALGHAGRLDDDLSDHVGEDQVFRDLEQLRGGAQDLDELRHAIATAAAVVVVIGPGWIATPRLRDPDDVVRVEVACALRSGCPVFPVLVGGATMPGADELPGDLAGLAGWHARPLTDPRWRLDVQDLIADLERYVTGAVHESPFPAVGARVEEQDSWFALGSGGEVTAAVVASLEANGWRVGPWEGGVTTLSGGSRLKTRVLGGMWVSDRSLPSTGRVAVRHGPRTRIDVALAEDLGNVLFVQMENRYRAWFRRCLDDLRAATGSGPDG